jgi:predicted RNase H-like HicB family nuclease
MLTQSHCFDKEYMAQIESEQKQVFRIELDREDDGRWIADIEAIPGALVYGSTREEAIAKVEALALRVIADRIEAEGMPQDQVRFEHCA